MTTTYGEAASLGFDRLVTLWGDGAVFAGDIGQGFWHAGNTLHTCVEHLLLKPPAQPHPIVEAGLDFFDKYRDTDPDPSKWTFWRDDYGWWGRSLLLAYVHADALQLIDAERYLEAAHTCWYGMSKAWDPETGGGCWNTPDHSLADSRKNSVTNELFFLLSMELADVPEAPAEDYRGWATQSRDWFLGFDTAKALYDDDGLIHETPGRQHVPGWVWSGDQGLYAACCAKAEQLLGPATPPGTYPDGKGLVEAVAAYLFDGDGVLFESKSYTQNTDVDYATGKGVFFRNATDLALFPDDSAVLTNASYVWNRRPEVGVWPPSEYEYLFAYTWNPGPEHPPVTQSGDLWQITVQTSGQDVLNAAARVAADIEIPPPHP